MRRIVVIGGGITGLTTALLARDHARAEGIEARITVLEASASCGGNIRTDRTDGYTIEQGPNGYLDNAPRTPALVRRLGLEDQVQKADETASLRFLYRGGRLHRLPTGSVGFLKSPLLSPAGRLRVMMEPFAKKRPEGREETIREFVSRRIGTEAADVLIDAMVSGVYAGDIRTLSLQSTFPKMAAMEAEHGGLVKAMLARMKERRAARKDVAARRARGEDVEDLIRPGGPAGPGGTLTSFREGLDTWVRALTRELGDAVRLASPVAAIRVAQAGDARYVVETTAGETVEADGVAVTVPAPKAAPILQPLDGELSGVVGSLPTASLAVVAVGLDSEAMGGAPDGFGFLVPRGEGIRILGCLWDSSVFPGRAPEGKVLLRAMIGGAHDPEAVTLPDADLERIVLDDLQVTMGLAAHPELIRIYRYPLGIGQYPVGHQAKLDVIADRLAASPGLLLGGSSYHGVSMNACIEWATEHAADLFD